MKKGNPKFTLNVIKMSPILPDYYQNRGVSKNFIKNSKQKLHDNSLGYLRTDRLTQQSW
jgi:hypothetical protein